MPDLSSRSQEIEIMDDLNCSGEVVNQTLRELDVINHLLGGNHVTLRGVKKLLKKADPSETIRIADLGCGSGDMLKRIARKNKKNEFTFDLLGIDANPHIIDFAAFKSSDKRIHFEAIDIFSDDFKKKKFDIVMATLFFHHFSSEQLITFFRQLRNQTAIGIVVNDIHRHPFAYYSIKLLTSIFSKSAMVKFDAPLSVRRAFSKKELINILDKSGITRYSLRWMWAFRWQLIIYTRSNS